MKILLAAMILTLSLSAASVMADETDTWTLLDDIEIVQMLDE